MPNCIYAATTVTPATREELCSESQTFGGSYPLYTAAIKANAFVAFELPELPFAQQAGRLKACIAGIDQLRTTLVHERTEQEENYNFYESCMKDSGRTPLSFEKWQKNKNDKLANNMQALDQAQGIYQAALDATAKSKG